jgi:hypothetical protein
MGPAGDTAGGDVTVEAPPQVFVDFCTIYWGLPAPLQRSLWSAFRRVEGEKPCTLRQTWLFFNSPQVDPYTLIHRTCSPQRIVEALECMVEEQILARDQATAAEELIFTHVQASGAWR